MTSEEIQITVLFLINMFIIFPVTAIPTSLATASPLCLILGCVQNKQTREQSLKAFQYIPFLILQREVQPILLYILTGCFLMLVSGFCPERSMSF